MYPPGTIVERAKPLDDVEVSVQQEDLKYTTEKRPNPHNVLRIIGSSPIKQESQTGWNGTGDHILVAPAEEFGPNEIMPESYLNENYDVRTFGDEEAPKKIVLDPGRERLQQRSSPEQAFARASREGAEKPAAEKRQRTPIKAADDA